MLASTDAVPTQSDPEFANYNTVEQRLFVKSGGSKEKLLYLYRRVKGRGGAFSVARIGSLVVPSSGVCVPTVVQTINSDTLRLNSNYGSSASLLGNELFVGEPGAVGSIFAVGEVHYYTRASADSDFVRQSGFFSPTQSNGAEFGRDIDYDGTRVIVGEPNVVKLANIFTVTSGVTTFEAEIAANTYTDSASRFSRGVAINGNHCLIGAPGQDLTTTDQGGVEYWERVGSTWTFRQAFTMNGTPATQAYFGSAVAMTDDSTAYISWVTGGTIIVEKWTRAGTTWSFDNADIQFVGYGGASFMQMDTDGTNLILGFPVYDNGGLTSDNYGLALVFDQSGNILSEIVGETLGNQLGGGVTLDGAEAVIGEPFADPSATSAAGTVSLWDVCV